MSGRIKKSNPKIRCTATNYRRLALPYLKKDFENRCAYSMIHVVLAGGETCMEVDHFKPKNKPSKKTHSYKNLMLASRHCNSAKGEEWPNAKLRKQGFEFINPCEEMDYGKHIFENIETGKLVPATPKGAYQINKCMLNADHLVTQRKQRTELLNLLKSTKPISLPNDIQMNEAKIKLKTLINNIENFKERYIPYIPPLPKK